MDYVRILLLNIHLGTYRLIQNERPFYKHRSSLRRSDRCRTSLSLSVSTTLEIVEGLFGLKNFYCSLKWTLDGRGTTLEERAYGSLSIQTGLPVGKT